MKRKVASLGLMMVTAIVTFILAIATLIVPVYAKAETIGTGNGNVASIGNAYYTSLQDAIEGANENEVITLIDDVTLSETIRIEKALTINLNGFKVTADVKKAFEVYANATFTDGTIEALNRCVDTRKAVELTLDTVTLIADSYISAYGNPQPLTIGGSDIDKTKVTVIDSNISARDGYGIIVFVKTEMTVSNSNISGYNVLYVKDTAQYSTFNFVGSKLTSDMTNNDVEGNSFNTIAIRADNVTVKIDQTSTVDAKGNYMYAIGFGGGNGSDQQVVTGAKVNALGVIKGNIVSSTEYNGNVLTISQTNASKVIENGFAYVTNDDGTITLAKPVASIGNMLYATLDDAIDSVIGTEAEIVILSQTNETISILQTDGTRLTINGDNNVFKGFIKIDGESRTQNREDEYITIKNVNFETDEANKTFIDGQITNHYPHNITIEDCSFLGTFNNDTVAMRFKSTYGLTVKNVSARGMHSLAQNTSGYDALIENVSVTESKSGISLGTVQGLTIKNSTFDTIGDDGYGVRVNGHFSTETIIENVTAKAFIPVLVRNVDEGEGQHAIVIEGTNNFTATNPDGYLVAISAGDYDDKNPLVVPSKQISLTINDDSLDVQNVFGLCVQIDGINFSDIEDAVAYANENGGTITLLCDIELTDKTLTVSGDKAVVLDLNGYKIVGAPTIAKAYSVITNSGNLTITGGGSIICNHALAGSTSYAVNTIVNSGKLVINGAIIKNTSTASYQIGYAIDNNSTSYDSIVEILDGKIIASGSYYYDGIRLFANNQTKENTVIVKGGEISGIWMQNPSDGTNENTKDVKAEIDVKGGEIGYIALEPSTSFEASISGGQIGSVSYFQEDEGRNLVGFISGGSFDEGFDASFIKDGAEFIVKEDGSFAVGNEAQTEIDAYAVAKIGNAYYESIQSAIDSLTTGDVEIEILKDSDEDVKIIQKQNLNLVLNGNGKTYSGKIKIDGAGRSAGAETLTIKNFNFVTTGGVDYFIDANASYSGNNYNYAHNVTVENCSFTATGAGLDSTAAMRIRQGFNIAITGCTSDGLHSVLQGYGISGVKVTGLTITSGKNGISAGTSKEVSIENVSFNTTGYGIRADGTGAYQMSIKNSQITSARPIIVRDVTGPYALTVKDTSLTAGAEGYGIILTALDDEEPLTVPSALAKVNTSNVSGLGEVFGAFAEVNGNYFVDLQDAIDKVEENETITILNNVQLTKALNVVKGKKFTIELNGKVISRMVTETLTKNEALLNNNGELTIIDSVGGGALTYNYTGAGNDKSISTISNTNSLTIDGISVINQTTVDCYSFAIDSLTNGGMDDVTLIIKDSNVISNYRSIRQFANSATCVNSLTISGDSNLVGQVWLHSPNALENKASIIINGGNFAPAGNDTSSVFITTTSSSSISADVTAGNFATKIGVDNFENLSNFISGGTFGMEIPEELWKPGYVIIYQDGVYQTMDMVEFSEIVADYLDEIANTYITQNVYSNVGINYFASTIESAKLEIHNHLYMSQVEQTVKLAEEIFDNILTSLQAQEFMLDYAITLKNYAELKKVDFNDQRIIDEFSEISNCALKVEMQSIVISTYDVIDEIANENEEIAKQNALALQNAKDQAIATLLGDNNQNVNHVTSSMIASINVCQTIEQVQNALTIAQTELAEIITYKGYIQNASNKADQAVQGIGTLSNNLLALEQSLGTKFEGLNTKIDGAIETINKIKEDTQKVLENAATKSELQAKLDELNTSIQGVTTDVTAYIRDNVLPAIQNYATQTNGAISTLSNAVTSLENVLGSKIDGVQSTVNAIKPLTKTEVEDILANGLSGLDSKFNDLSNKILANKAAIENAVGEITSAINGYVTQTNGAIDALKGAVTSLENVLGSKIDDVQSTVNAIKPLTKTEVEDILANGLSGLDSKFSALTAEIEGFNTNVTTAVGEIKQLIEEVKTQVDDVSAKAQQAAQSAANAAEKALEAANSVKDIPTSLTSVQQAVLAAQQAAQSAQTAVSNISSIIANLEQTIQTGTDAALAAQQAAQSAANAAAKAEEAAKLAAENAQTVEVKSHAVVTETELKGWLDEYLGSLQAQAQPIGLYSITTVTPTDTYRDELIEKLAVAYTKENADLVLSYYDQAIAQINSAVSKEEVNYALATFKSNVSLVDSLATLTPTPAYNDNSVVTLLIVVIAVETVIALAIVVALILVVKAKKNGNGDDNQPKSAPIEVVTIKEAEVVATKQPEEVIEEIVEQENQQEQEEQTQEEQTENQSSNAFAINAGEFRSFEERLVELDEVVKDGYKLITEELLSYKRVNARLSKSALSFRFGRTLIAKMTVRGKTLRVYLALDPNAYEVSKFFQKDASAVKAYAEVPMLMRVRSARAGKKTASLISDLANKFELVKKPQGSAIDSRFAFLHKKNLSFEDRLATAEIVVKQGYETIKENLLSYKKVNARISKKAVSFRLGRKLLCKMNIRGKTLRVYLALDPNAYEVSKFFQRNASDVKAYAEVPMLMRVRSARAIKRVCKLVEELEKANELVKKPQPKQ